MVLFGVFCSDSSVLNDKQEDELDNCSSASSEERLLC